MNRKSVILIVIGGILMVQGTAVAGKIDNEIQTIFREGGQAAADTVTADDLRGLPVPVQRWLQFAGIIGKPEAVSVRLKQEGYFRRSPEGKWMPYTAEQYYTTDVPAFIWRARIKAAPLFWLKVRDRYFHGKGNMWIRLWGLITVGDMTDPKLDQGTLLRYLNETMWFPSAALNEFITWEAIDDTSARATMEYKGVKASAVFFIDDQGRITNMVADRYREVNGEFEMNQWSTPISEYKTFHGIAIPAKGKGVWNLEDRQFDYIRLEITDIEYNVPEIY